MAISAYMSASLTTVHFSSTFLHILYDHAMQRILDFPLEVETSISYLIQEELRRGLFESVRNFGELRQRL